MPDNGILVAILLAIVGQTAVMWRRLGNIESANKSVLKEQSRVATELSEVSKKGCPFPACPVFHRAMEEAAPVRLLNDEEETRRE